MSSVAIQRLLAFLAGMAAVLGIGWLVFLSPGVPGLELDRAGANAGPAPAGYSPPAPEQVRPRQQDGGERPERPRGGSSRRPQPLALDGGRALDVGLRPRPAAGLVFDLDSGRVLWHRRARTVLPIASTTKIMSALIAVRATRPHDTIRVTREMRDFGGAAVGLPSGKRVRVESLLAAMLIQSGNDAALALAVESAGSIGRFVREMNERAGALGLRCTRFVSPHGLEARNRSCAADLAILARLAMQQPRITRIVRRSGAKVPWPGKPGVLHLAPTNPLLIAGYRGTIGLKTGYTEAAGRSLVAVVRRGGRTLGAVLLDSPAPGQQATKLFDAAFAERRGRRPAAGAG
jgi:D-alanyl-D-alanine carboxypeptidase